MQFKTSIVYSDYKVSYNFIYNLLAVQLKWMAQQYLMTTYKH